VTEKWAQNPTNLGVLPHRI